jgi:methylthioribose-1-phosphate isomerase
MRVNGVPYRTIWLKPDDPQVVQIIDQRCLPHEFRIVDLTTLEITARAIKDMWVRGAGLIGATAAYGMYLAALQPYNSLDHALHNLNEAGALLKQTRPTAVNLAWAVDRQLAALRAAKNVGELPAIALENAEKIAAEDADYCRQLGLHGLGLIEAISQRKSGEVVNVLTHCNAGWLAFVDYGSATAPIYAAFDKGIRVHVWVDETRPRNQGARLTAWELGQHGVPHTIIADNVGGHLMQHGMVDLVITGADRVTRCGDAANKIGTYLKALAAKDNDVPFYVALPSSTFDWAICDGVREIPIEQRGDDEVKYIEGVLPDGTGATILITPPDSPAANYGFDVTPARLITGLISERGICAAAENSILALYPERR